MLLKNHIQIFRLLVAVMLLAPIVALSQISTLGKVVRYTKTQTGVLGNTDNGRFRVQVYNANTIRVTVTQAKQFSTFSYLLASTNAPTFADFRIQEANNRITISTAAITTVIEKQPYFKVSFLNSSGLELNEDVAGNGLGTNFIGQRSNLYKKLQPGERFIGLGEVLGNLDKRGNGYTLNNTDTYKYGDPRLPMYTNVPFYIGIHQQKVYGLFYHNTYKSFFNFGLSTPNFTSITADGGEVDYFFIHDTNISNILYHYTELTGRMPLPPKWSIGYHQSRCSYFPQAQVEWLANTFRQKQIPIDGIVLDADYLQEYEPFRINTNRFPSMAQMAAKLRALNIELTASVNPGIKIDSTYIGHTDGLKNDVFIKFADGSDYVADIAPSTNHFVDFTKPTARQWWKKHMNFLPQNGIHGYWNDMNEPAVGGSYLPDNLIFDFDGHKATALEAKNVYGMQMARSSFEAAQQNSASRRPFVLTRSGFAGVQRYAAVWTGDNTAKEEYLLGGQLLNTQMGLSGIPFVGDDIGGYIGTTSKELFARWIQVGALEPYARNHKEAYANANDPWSYGEEAEAISKAYIGFRYQLMPYLYSLFNEAHETGMPISRSLAIYYPHDEKVYNNVYQYQSLLGNALMVVPVMPSEKTKKYYLPKGNWFNIYTDEQQMGNTERTEETVLHQLPLFVKGGSIIPMQSAVQSTRDKASDTLYLHVYEGIEKNQIVLYEDDGDGLQYTQQQFARRTIEYDPSKNLLQCLAQTGNFQSAYTQLKIFFHGSFHGMHKIKVNEQTQQVSRSINPLLNPLKELSLVYDPVYTASLQANEIMAEQKTITIPYTAQSIQITW
ncbi:MAG: glycoside hydrolase family 31 protein [Ferruginibacter sp.]